MDNDCMICSWQIIWTREKCVGPLNPCHADLQVAAAGSQQQPISNLHFWSACKRRKHAYGSLRRLLDDAHSSFDGIRQAAGAEACAPFKEAREERLFLEKQK